MKIILLTVALIVTSLWTVAPVAAATTTTYVAATAAECAQVPASAKTTSRGKLVGCRYELIESGGPHLSGSGTGWIQLSGPYGVWSQKDSYGYHYTKTRIYIDWISCTKQGFAYDVRVDWCGAYNSGGTFMEPGSNFTVSVLLNGFPVYTSYWMRKRYYAGGGSARMTWGRF